MSKPEADLPARLRAVGATDLERRLLDAAGREQPSRELSERMARAIGVALPAVPDSMPSADPSPPSMSGGAATPASALSSLLPWIAGALVVVGGALFVGRSSHPAESPSVVASAVTAPAPSGAPLGEVGAESSGLQREPAQVTSAPLLTEPLPTEQSASVPERARSSKSAPNLSAQIALLDTARAAIAQGHGTRALGLIREYRVRYPRGAFRPEASALEVEALVEAGRMPEARALAERFVTTYGSSPLAARVARLTAPKP